MVANRRHPSSNAARSSVVPHRPAVGVSVVEGSFQRNAYGAWRVLRKELLEARRDRNLVLQLVLVPLLLYPTLAFVGIQLALMAQGAAESRPATILLDADTPPDVRRALEAEPSLRPADAPDAWSREDGAPPIAAFRAWREHEADSPEIFVGWWNAGAVDSVAVLYDASRERSTAARERVIAAVRAHSDSVRVARADAVGLDEADLHPWRVLTRDLSTAAERGGRILALVLPLLLVLMLPPGLFHAALDTFVGERERGTWETLLTSPLERTPILLGKLVYVVLAGMVTFLLNFVGLMILVVFGLGILLPDAPLELTLEAGPVVIALAAVLLMSIAVSALMMMLAAGARNHREGQAALTPVYLVTAFAGFFSGITQETFTVQQALIPLANVTGMLRAALQGELPLVPAVVTFLELLLLAWICLRLASRLVRDEALLFAPEFSWRRALLRGARPRVERTGAR